MQEQLEKKITEQHKETEKQISGMQAQLQDEKEMLQAASQIQENLLQQSKQIQSSLVTGLRLPFEFTLTKFSVHKTKGARGTWKSDPFYSHPGGYKFKLGIDTNGSREAQGTHITADLYPQKGEHDDNLSWPIKVTAHLQLLNQQGDHGRVVAGVNTRVDKGDAYHREMAHKFIAHSELGHNAVKATQYLKDDCLHFRLYLKVTPQTV